MAPEERTGRYISLRTRIIVSFIVLLTFALTIAGVTFNAVQQRSVEARIDGYLTKVADELRLLAASGVDPETGEPFTGPSQLLRTSLQRQALGHGEGEFAAVGGRVRWIAASTVVLRPERDRELLDHVLPLTTGTDVRRGRLKTALGEYAYIVIPVQYESGSATGSATGSKTGDDQGALVHVHDIGVEQGQVADNVQRFILVAIGALALTSGIVWLLAGRLLRPIEWLRRTTASIGPGDLTTRVPVRGHL